jgi:NAD(P)-dependent dehydrogenase (short-subunit alcohol dehydrogenase family)
MDLKLKDLHVFVTGSAGDIGRACAAKYLEHGAKVTLHYNSQANTLASLTEAYPTRTTLVQADLSNEAQTIQAMKTAVDKFGPCHILVANHAIYETKEVPIQDMSLEQFKHTIDINLVGVFLITREFMKQLKTFADTLTQEQKLNTHASVGMGI